MAYCCVASEVLYIILFLLAKSQSESVIEVLLRALKHGYLSFPVGIALFGWAIKQAINVIQMKTAADVCMLYDINRKQKHCVDPQSNRFSFYFVWACMMLCWQGFSNMGIPLEASRGCEEIL
ncbi:hypothetical protein MKX03_015411 [Papaver bracteatum]|nr:hypothetical protein MKX03_015411 [Papaver bracteatum]